MKCPDCNCEFEIEWKTNKEIKDSLSKQRDKDLEEGCGRKIYKYDEKLTSEGKRMSIQTAQTLIEEYGLPDIIYYSPFYRTRQTRKKMVKAINEYKDNLSENDDSKYKKN